MAVRYLRVTTIPRKVCRVNRRFPLWSSSVLISHQGELDPGESCRPVSGGVVECAGGWYWGCNRFPLGTLCKLVVREKWCVGLSEIEFAWCLNSRSFQPFGDCNGDRILMDWIVGTAVHDWWVKVLLLRVQPIGEVLALMMIGVTMVCSIWLGKAF
ncbi:hypothetical protein Tco_0455141 [Tanacetum coccineum]